MLKREKLERDIVELVNTDLLVPSDHLLRKGVASHKIICDDHGKPFDYAFLSVNGAFEEFTGLDSNRIIGKGVWEVIPLIREDDFDWRDIRGQCH